VVRTPIADDLTPVVLVLDHELVLAAPAEVAWPHVRAYETWQTYSRVEHVSGEPGGLGEVVLLEKEGVPDPFYTRTVLFVPGRRFIGKMYPLEGSSWFGFAEFRLDDVDGGVKLSVHGLYEYLVPEPEVEAFRASFAADETFGRSLQKLKALVEGSSLH
jgi:hypothetical protein